MKIQTGKQSRRHANHKGRDQIRRSSGDRRASFALRSRAEALYLIDRLSESPYPI